MVSRFVSDIDSRIFYDLVLHYSTIGEDEDNPRYYLHDCYPAQFINDERTKANIKKMPCSGRHSPSILRAKAN